MNKTSKRKRKISKQERKTLKQQEKEVKNTGPELKLQSKTDHGRRKCLIWKSKKFVTTVHLWAGTANMDRAIEVMKDKAGNQGRYEQKGCGRPIRRG